MNHNRNAKQSESQCQLILKHLQAGHALTQFEALKRPFRCLRLGARIWELEQEGHAFNKPLIKTPSGKRVTCYSLAPRDEAIAS